MENILTVLDTVIAYDDERNTVSKEGIKKIRQRLEDDVNLFGFKPESVYKNFREYIDSTGRGSKLSNKEMAYRYAEFYLFRIAMQWVWFFGTVSEPTHSNSRTKEFYLVLDDRNKRAAELCREICKMEEFQNLLSDYGEELDYTQRPSRDEDVLYRFYHELMLDVNQHMHNTLKQTATQLMVYALTTLSDKNSKELKEKLEEKYGMRFYGLPMI